MSCNQSCNTNNTSSKKNNVTNNYSFVLVLFILIALVGSAWSK